MIIPFFMGHFEIRLEPRRGAGPFFPVLCPTSLRRQGHREDHRPRTSRQASLQAQRFLSAEFSMGIYHDIPQLDGVFPLENPMFKHKCFSMDMGTMHWKPPSATHLFDLYVHRIQIHMLLKPFASRLNHTQQKGQKAPDEMAKTRSCSRSNSYSNASSNSNNKNNKHNRNKHHHFHDQSLAVHKNIIC